MTKLSISIPQNELIKNPSIEDAEWSALEICLKKYPKGFHIPMVINGKKIYGEQKIQNINPSTGEVLGSLSQSDKTHAKAAIEAALQAKKEWARLKPSTRIQKFRDLESILNKWKYELCSISMVECGYNALETYVEWAELLDFIRFDNYFYEELLNEKLGDGWSETNELFLRPLKGFTCAVSPFNFPQAIGFHLPLVMALTGNTVVWKPSEDATMSAYLLMLALDEAGFPPGVINMITGEGYPCLPEVLTHPQLSAVNFTGSFSTAKSFSHYLFSKEYPRHNFPRFIAETGGKNFLVADKNIDILDTARLIVQGAYGRSGQKCSANSLVFVNEQIWPQLKPILKQEIELLRICASTERFCDVGPVINERQFNKIKGYIDRGLKHESCSLVAGGKYSSEKGYYVYPTLFEVIQEDHELLQEEIFGPVSVVKTYKTLDEVVSLIEKHNYRLTGSVVSRDETFLEKATPILSEFAGNFYINRKTTGAIVNMQPFGGDGASGTNGKAGNKWHLLHFISQGTVTRRHTKSTTPSLFELCPLSKV